MKIDEIKKQAQDRIEGNILIAEFMGLKHPPNIFEYKIKCGWGGLKLNGSDWYIKKDKEIYLTDALEYHYNWSWLMEVVEIISKKYSFYCSNESGQWQILIDISDTNVIGSDMLVVMYESVIHHIKWHNNQNKI